MLWILGSTRPILELPDPPITNHEQLIARIEKKFIGNDRAIALGGAGPSNAPKTDWITPEYRPIVINYLKNKARDPKYFDRSLRVLVALNDEETMKDVLRQYNDGTLIDDTILMMNLDAQKIKDLVPIIYSGSDTPRKVWNSVILKSPRICGVNSILDLMRWSPQFDDKTNQWASRLRGNIINYDNLHQDNLDEAHTMWLFQQWWEHNKAAMLEGRYSEAKWLPMYKGEPDCYYGRQREQPEYLIYSSTTRNDILPIPKTADIQLPSHPAAAPSHANSSTISARSLVLYSGLGLLICGLVGGWLTKRMKPTGG